MNEDANKLLENLMGALGDNPAESIGQMLSSLPVTSESDDKEHNEGTQEKGSGLDPSILFKLQGLMGNQNQSDERSALLLALRPFLSEERRPQVDQAIKMLRLSQLAKTAQELELFKNLL